MARPKHGLGYSSCRPSPLGSLLSPCFFYSPVLRHGNRLFAEDAQVDRTQLGRLFRRSLGDDLAATTASRRPEIRADRRRWPLFRDRARPPRAYCPSRGAFHRVQQPAVIARMQPDGRLVEDVQHAAQSAAHLARQADALHFAAGQRGGGRASVRYSRPTSTRNCSRLRISRPTSPATFRAAAVNFQL